MPFEKVRKFAKRLGAPIHRVSHIDYDFKEPEPSGDHMVHRLKIRPTSPELKEKFGIVNIDGYLPPGRDAIKLNFTYHGGRISTELTTEETKRLMPFSIHSTDQRWNRAPIFHADPSDPTIKKFIGEGRLKIHSDNDGKTAELSLPDELFNALSGDLFYHYIGGRAQWVAAKNSTLNRDEFDSREQTRDRWAKSNKRHQKLIHMVILHSIESMRATKGRSILSWNRMNAHEKGLVGSVLEGLLPNIAEGQRKELVRRVGVSLVRNLSEDAKDPMESARRLSHFLNKGAHMNELRKNNNIGAFRPEELIRIVDIARSLKSKRKGEGKE